METQTQAKDLFFATQAGILALVVLILYWRRSRKDSSSQFGMREAERDRTKTAFQKTKGALDSPQTKSERMTGAGKAEKAAPRQLEGIRIDGPPHSILGIPADASKDEIQKAYRDQMKRFHPDLVGPPGSREWKDAQKIAEAIIRAKEEMLKRTRL